MTIENWIGISAIFIACFFKLRCLLCKYWYTVDYCGTEAKRENEQL